MTSFTVIALFSGACFLFYGFSCLLSNRMALEFERFGIPQYRNLTGILQILGGSSIILGLYTISILGFMGALGLSLLMFLGFGVRLKIKDSFVLSAPAFLFGLLNAYLAYRFFLML
ncbi:DoxX family protein [Nonlabens ulvanivorans]|uniref:DoxX family protein n=1 Tax=Nonlabens ulvanivorans TaxID=906888 RepID=UPI0037C9AD91